MIEVFWATLTPMLTMFVCIAVGFTIRKAGIVDHSAGKTLSKLVAGFTIANFSVIDMLKKPKVYIASVLRLTLIPAALIAATYAAKELLGAALGLCIDHNVLYLLLFATATPLGLNTVVFPEAYGGDAETGAGMTMISHIMCVPLMPLMYSLLTLVFGPAAF